MPDDIASNMNNEGTLQYSFAIIDQCCHPLAKLQTESAGNQETWSLHKVSVGGEGSSKYCRIISQNKLSDIPQAQCLQS